MKTKYELFCRETGVSITVYMGHGRDQELFYSVEQARKSNCHGVYEDRVKYGVREVQLISSEVNLDPPTKAEVKEASKQAEAQAALEKEMDALGLKGMDRAAYSMSKAASRVFLDAMLKGPFGEILTANSYDPQ